MTTLIYRGTAHTPLTNAARRTARDLVYRGQRHDGLSPRRARGLAAMCYRGVAWGAAASAQAPVAPAAILPAE